MDDWKDEKFPSTAYFGCHKDTLYPLDLAKTVVAVLGFTTVLELSAVSVFGKVNQ